MRISNEVLGIGVPCTFPFVPISFVHSFVLMEKPSFQYITCDNGPIDTLRNDIVKKALECGVTKLIMMDVDQVYPPDTITKLLKHKHPLVGVSVNRRYPPFDPIIMKLTDKGYELINDYEPGDLVECDATGAGCVAYDMSIFKELPYPWFEFKKDEETGMVIGEDIGLCQNLKAKGHKIYVDTSVEVGHLTTMVVSNATHELYKAMKCDPEQKQAALGIGKE